MYAPYIYIYIYIHEEYIYIYIYFWVCAGILIPPVHTYTRIYSGSGCAHLCAHLFAYIHISMHAHSLLLIKRFMADSAAPWELNRCLCSDLTRSMSPQLSLIYGNWLLLQNACSYSNLTAHRMSKGYSIISRRNGYSRRWSCKRKNVIVIIAGMKNGDEKKMKEGREELRRCVDARRLYLSNDGKNKKE